MWYTIITLQPYRETDGLDHAEQVTTTNENFLVIM